MSIYIAILIAEVVLAALALWLLPGSVLKGYAVLSAERRFEASLEIRKLIVNASGAILVASSAFLAWQEFRLEEYKDFGQQVGTAMVLLKEDNTTSRIGGIYGLARVIEDSPDDADHLLAALAFNINDWASKRTNGKDQAVSIETTVAFITFGRNQLSRLQQCGGTRFTQLNLRYVRANNTSYRHCEFLSVDFTESQFAKADFAEARLTTVNFEGADLADANFRNANLHATTFVGADLRGADFTGVTGLQAKFFKAARVSKKTKFPPSIVAKLGEYITGELN